MLFNYAQKSATPFYSYYSSLELEGLTTRVLLLRAGDVESNPGPLKEDNLLLEEDKRFTDQNKAKNSKAKAGGATGKAKR